MSYIVCIILGIVIGGLGIYFVLKPKIMATQELDQETLVQNQKIHEENTYLTQTNIKFTKDKISLESKVDELKNSISNLEEASRTAAEKLYNSSMETM
jgi:short subunit fatty acids transporter